MDLISNEKSYSRSEIRMAPIKIDSKCPPGNGDRSIANQPIPDRVSYELRLVDYPLRFSRSHEYVFVCGLVKGIAVDQEIPIERRKPEWDHHKIQWIQNEKRKKKKRNLKRFTIRRFYSYATVTGRARNQRERKCAMQYYKIQIDSMAFFY